MLHLTQAIDGWMFLNSIKWKERNEKNRAARIDRMASFFVSIVKETTVYGFTPSTYVLTDWWNLAWNIVLWQCCCSCCGSCCCFLLPIPSRFLLQKQKWWLISNENNWKISSEYNDSVSAFSEREKNNRILIHYLQMCAMCLCAWNFPQNSSIYSINSTYSQTQMNAKLCVSFDLPRVGFINCIQIDFEELLEWWMAL